MAEQKKKSPSPEHSEDRKSGPLHGFAEAIMAEEFQFVEDVVGEAFTRRRSLLIQGTRERLSHAEKIAPNSKSTESNTDWILIESLSQLRKVVGGRLEILRDRWVKAGFALKEHRGSKICDKVADGEPWREFSLWLLEHGYEAKLAAAEAEHLFEVRKVEGRERK